MPIRESHYFHKLRRWGISSRVTFPESSPGPVDSGAPSSLAVVVEIDNTSVARIEAVLNGVDRALERLRAGTYRTCQVCGTQIDEAALVASPLLAHCPAHPELS
jgi:RNA polymerase-binding transcription factor DksA